MGIEIKLEGVNDQLLEEIWPIEGEYINRKEMNRFLRAISAKSAYNFEVRDNKCFESRLYLSRDNKIIGIGRIIDNKK